jgi:hypothetical protein
MKEKAVLVPSAVGLVFCAARSSTPVPVSVAVATKEGDFQKVGSVSLSAAASGDQDEKVNFEKQIRQAQCYHNKANPIIAATRKDFTVTLAGTFTDSVKYLIDQ